MAFVGATPASPEFVRATPASPDVVAAMPASPADAGMHHAAPLSLAENRCEGRRRLRPYTDAGTRS